jgi:hypothetical protein
MAGWDSFAVAIVGASAALTGLLFVAVSINLTRILSYPALPDRASQTLVVLMNILIIFCLMLIPGQSLRILGVEVLVVGIIVWLISLRLGIHSYRLTDPQYRRVLLMLTVLLQGATLPIIASGAITIIAGSAGLYWLVPAALISFVYAVIETWVLLIEINR